MGESRRNLPEIEVVGTDATSANSEEVVASRPPRRRLLVFAAVVGLLAVAVIAAQRDDQDPEAQQPPPSSPLTTLDSTSTTADGGTEEPSAGFYLSGVAEPVFDDVMDGSLLIGGRPGWRQVDLATGWVASLPDTAVIGVDARGMIPLRGGVAFTGPHGPSPRFLALPDIGPDADMSDVTSTGFQPDLFDDQEEAGHVVALHSAGSDDRLWVITSVSPFGSPVERHATLVSTNAQRLAGPFPIPADPIAGSEHGVVFNAGGRGFLAGPDGTTDLGEGEIYDTSASHAGRVFCNRSATCHQQTIDLTRGEIILHGPRIPTDQAAHDGVTMAVRDDGSLAVFPLRFDPRSQRTGQHAGTTSMHVTFRDGRSTMVAINDVRSPPVWLPDGNGLLVLTGRNLIHYTETDGELSARTVPGIRTEGATGAVFVPAGALSSEAPP